MNSAAADTLFVATRKGLMEVRRAPTPSGWRIGRCHFIAEPVTLALLDPRSGARYAALAHGHFGVKLHRSDDGGDTWRELPAPAHPPEDGGEGPSVSMVWSLEHGGADRPGRLWAGTLPGGLFRSDDGGESWALVESLWNVPERARWFGGGYDEPGLHTLLVDPRDSDTLTAAVSCGGIWRSRDAGASWQSVGEGLRADYVPPDQAHDLPIQDPHRLAVCAARPDVVWCQHHNGVFRSEDAGVTWRTLDAIRPSGFGFAVVAHPTDPDTAWFVPAVKDEERVPADRRLVVARTRDGGASFEVLDRGLPSPSFDIVYRHALALDGSGERLAMGSTTGNLFVSEDAGDSWQLVSAHLPPIHQVAFG